MAAYARRTVAEAGNPPGLGGRASEQAGSGVRWNPQNSHSGFPSAARPPGHLGPDRHRDRRRRPQPAPTPQRRGLARASPFTCAGVFEQIAFLCLGTEWEMIPFKSSPASQTGDGDLTGSSAGLALPATASDSDAGRGVSGTCNTRPGRSCALAQPRTLPFTPGRLAHTWSRFESRSNPFDAHPDCDAIARQQRPGRQGEGA